jgi:hypothetical protein
MIYVLTVTTLQKGALIIIIEDNVEQDRLDYSNKYNKWDWGGNRNNNKPKQNRMLENYFCNDRIRNDEVANILLSFNRQKKFTATAMCSHCKGFVKTSQYWLRC